MDEEIVKFWLQLSLKLGQGQGEVQNAHLHHGGCHSNILKAMTLPLAALKEYA